MSERIRHEYWNANGMAVAIVAIPGEADDWAAYIGGQPDPDFCGYHPTTQETLEWVKRHGCKLSERMARALFPEIELVYRR
jgi:hypothetical protein